MSTLQKPNAALLSVGEDVDPLQSLATAFGAVWTLVGGGTGKQVTLSWSLPQHLNCASHCALHIREQLTAAVLHLSVSSSLLITSGSLVVGKALNK